ncbi:hypothetical protein ES708_09086 [subsurface metagenome]
MRVLQFPSAYTKGERPYDIFKDRMTAINSITEGIRGIIKNKYYKQLNETMIEGLGKKISKDREAEKLNLYKGEPSEDIYKNVPQVVEQFVDYSMSPQMEREMMMGGLPSGVPGGVTPTAIPSEEVAIDKMNKQQLLDYAMSGGEMDWTNVLEAMKKRPAFLGEYSDLEKAALEGAMGRDVMGEKIEGIERATKISEYFAEPEKKIATSMTELAQTDWDKFVEIKQLEEDIKMTTAQKNVNMYIDMYNRKEITNDQFLKVIDAYVAPAKLSDFEKKLELLTETGMWDTMSEDNKLKFFGAYVGEEVGEKVTATEANFVEKQFADVKTIEQYDKAKMTVRQVDETVLIPDKNKIFKDNYDFALKGDSENAGIEDCINEKGFTKTPTEGVDYTMEYAGLYAEYEQSAKEHYKATGEILSKDFLSLEETEKVGHIKGAVTPGVARGQYEVVNTEKIPWSWESEEGKETPKEVKEKEDEFGYIVGATYKNPETGKLLKYLGNNEWEEIKPGEAARKRE